MLILYETHSDNEHQQIWRNEWGGGDVIMSHGDPNARGVAMFVKKNTTISIERITIDQEGRYIICDIIENNVKITCAAIYGPNKDDPKFFKNISDLIRERSEHKVIIGDFNVTLDVEYDRSNTYHNNEKARDEVINCIEEYNLREIWRERNPEKREYSWHKAGNLQKASRIDYALISSGLDQKVKNCQYVSSVMTDHRAFLIVIDVAPYPRGSGYWKFNNMLLQDREFVKTMNDQIQKTIEQNQNFTAKQKSEKLKSQIKKFSTQYSRNKIKDDEIIIAQLNEKVDEMFQRGPLNRQESELLQNTQNDLEEKVLEKIRGIMFRSKAKWYEEGEKSTKYFFALEKAKYNAKTCFSIHDKEGNLVDNPESIIRIQQEFYQELYQEEQDINFTLKNNSPTRVPEELRITQEQQITTLDLEEAIKGMNNNKTPGSDGIPVDFYKVFWTRLKVCFYEMMEETFNHSLLHETARTGILNLIPKANKDTRYIKNLRPITLLNTDYKIVEKAIANKMIPALKI